MITLPKPLTLKQIQARFKRSKATHYDVYHDFNSRRNVCLCGMDKEYILKIAVDPRYVIHKLIPVKPIDSDFVRSFGSLD